MAHSAADIGTDCIHFECVYMHNRDGFYTMLLHDFYTDCNIYAGEKMRRRNENEMYEMVCNGSK